MEQFNDIIDWQSITDDDYEKKLFFKEFQSSELNGFDDGIIGLKISSFKGAYKVIIGEIEESDIENISSPTINKKYASVSYINAEKTIDDVETIAHLYEENGHKPVRKHIGNTLFNRISNYTNVKDVEMSGLYDARVVLDDSIDYGLMNSIVDYLGDSVTIRVGVRNNKPVIFLESERPIST